MTTEEHKDFSLSGTKNIRGRFIIQEIQDPIQEETKFKSSIITTDLSRRLNKSKSQSKFRTNSKPNALNVTNKKFDVFVYEFNHHSYINASFVVLQIKTDNKQKRPVFRPKLSHLIDKLDDNSPGAFNHFLPGLLKKKSIPYVPRKARKCSYDFISHNLQTVMTKSLQAHIVRPHHSLSRFPMLPIMNTDNPNDIKSLYNNKHKLREFLTALSGYECALLKETHANSFSIFSYSIYHCSFNL